MDAGSTLTLGLDGFDAADNRLREPLGDHLQRRMADPALGLWGPVLARWWTQPPAQALVAMVQARQRQDVPVYPAQVLRALELTPLESVRVIILGQDPYHGPGQAQGLAFSVAPGTRLPPSLRNILQEVRRDIGHVSEPAGRGDLSGWARQGVLLLNTALTVEQGRAAAHAGPGWALLADALIEAAVVRALADGRPPVLMLWGAHAQSRRVLLDRIDPTGRCLVLTANHPSPLSARRPPVPFLGCGHFSRARDFAAACAPQRPALVW